MALIPYLNTSKCILILDICTGKQDSKKIIFAMYDFIFMLAILSPTRSKLQVRSLFLFLLNNLCSLEESLMSEAQSLLEVYSDFRKDQQYILKKAFFLTKQSILCDFIPIYSVLF